MKKVLCVFMLFAFVFSNVSFAPAMAATYQMVEFRNEVVYPPTATKRVTQTVTETTVTETTSTRVFEEPVIEEVVINEKKSNTGEKIAAVVFGTLLIGGIIALAAIDDGPSHHHKPHRTHHGHKPPHRR